MHRDATFSPCGKYRYTLERIWDKTKPLLLYVMLNPSKADNCEDDKTINRCYDFAPPERFGGILVGNLYALIETDSRLLLARVRDYAWGRVADHPVGETDGVRNDAALKELHNRACTTIVAWGANGSKPRVRDRKRDVVALLDGNLYALGEPTAKGEPRHPSRLANASHCREYHIG